MEGDNSLDTEVGSFDEKTECENFVPLCPQIISSSLSAEITCRLQFCREHPDDDCFFSDEANETCPKATTKFKTSARRTHVNPSEPFDLGRAKIVLDKQYYADVSEFHISMILN